MDFVQASGMAWTGDSVSLLAHLATEDEAIARERDRRHCIAVAHQHWLCATMNWFC